MGGKGKGKGKGGRGKGRGRALKRNEDNVPQCPGHAESCVLRTVVKDGPNRGRRFWSQPAHTLRCIGVIELDARCCRRSQDDPPPEVHSSASLHLPASQQLANLWCFSSCVLVSCFCIPSCARVVTHRTLNHSHCAGIVQGFRVCTGR